MSPVASAPLERCCVSDWSLASSGTAPIGRMMEGLEAKIPTTSARRFASLVSRSPPQHPCLRHPASGRYPRERYGMTRDGTERPGGCGISASATRSCGCCAGRIRRRSRARSASRRRRWVAGATPFCPPARPAAPPVPPVARSCRASASRSGVARCCLSATAERRRSSPSRPAARGPAEVEAMRRTASPSSGKPDGVAAVCLSWPMARATVWRHRVLGCPAPPRLRPRQGHRPRPRPSPRPQRCPHAARGVGLGAAGTWPTTFKKSHAARGSRTPPPASAHRRGTAAPNVSCALSRRTSSGRASSTASRTYARRCSNSARSTTPRGPSSATASGQRAPSATDSFPPQLSPYRLQPDVSQTKGGATSSTMARHGGYVPRSAPLPAPLCRSPASQSRRASRACRRRGPEPERHPPDFPSFQMTKSVHVLASQQGKSTRGSIRTLYRTITFRNCQGSSRSTSSANRPGRLASGVQVVKAPTTGPR
jgi:hypothetical protein